MPKILYDVIGLKPMSECSLILHLADSTYKKPFERIYDAPIIENSIYVLADFIIMDIECNLSCPNILHIVFLITVKVVIDIEGSDKYKISTLWENEWNTFQGKFKWPYESIMRATYSLRTIDAKFAQETLWLAKMH